MPGFLAILACPRSAARSSGELFSILAFTISIPVTLFFSGCDLSEWNRKSKKNTAPNSLPVRCICRAVESRHRRCRLRCHCFSIGGRINKPIKPERLTSKIDNDDIVDAWVPCIRRMFLYCRYKTSLGLVPAIRKIHLLSKRVLYIRFLHAAHVSYSFLVYIIACIYCVHMISKNDTYEMPVITFLVILGFGIFAYFQGRSYDLAVNGIMYPSIVLIGLFSKKLFFYILPFMKKLHEGTVIVLMPLIFICDGAASMVYHTRSIHHYAKANWASPIDHYESDLSKKLQFIEHSIAPKDTVLIIAKNYESFYYAAGGYYNPLDLPGSTELFFKAEIDTLKDYIKRCRYPIIFEPTLSWPYLDTIMHTLSEYTVVQSRLENFNLLLLKPVEKIRHKLSIDTNTILYDANGYFSRYLQPLAPITLPENYDIELIISAEKSTLDSDKVVCCNPSQNYPFRGIFIKQEASNPLEYLFAFGDGKSWCSKAKFKLDAKRINDILISVRKDKITIYNNNSLCAEANTDCQIMNSDGNFLFNSTYMGVVNEIRISAQ